MVFNPQLLLAQSASSVKLVVFVVFLAAATLFIGLNHQVFQIVLGEKSKTYWWIFIVLVTLPFLLILYAFSLLFGDSIPLR